MKVVLLAGGLGTRMREETEFRPKPMVEVGGKPVLWHIMKIFAAYGHTDFIICAGYKGEQIKNYFYNYAAMNMDFTLTLGDSESATFHRSHDEFDWTVTVADTGPDTPTGGRINKIKRYLGDEPFFCTYGDGIAPVPIDELVNAYKRSEKTAMVTLARPPSRFGIVRFDSDNIVQSFEEKPRIDAKVSIGYFIFGPGIFEYLTDDSVLESSILPLLVERQELAAFEYSGFWQAMDTQRELQLLQEMWTEPNPPWKVW